MGRSKYKTLPDLRKPETVRRIYRALQILHANAMCRMGLLLVFLNGHFMSTCMFCNAVLMQYWTNFMTMYKVKFLGMGFMVTGFRTFVLQVGRHFFAKGVKVLNSWKGDRWGSLRENKLMKRFHKSCKLQLNLFS